MKSRDPELAVKLIIVDLHVFAAVLSQLDHGMRYLTDTNALGKSLRPRSC